MGSTFKALTVAMALDSGKITLKSAFDASHALQYGKFTIHRFPRPEPRLTVPEIFTYSSNIGSARMAVSLGSSTTNGSSEKWASSTGCAPNCRKARNRWRPGAGPSSTR
jgi:cell division protein FtsI/penicillin-binding protein 2